MVCSPQLQAATRELSTRLAAHYWACVTGNGSNYTGQDRCVCLCVYLCRCTTYIRGGRKYGIHDQCVVYWRRNQIIMHGLVMRMYVRLRILLQSSSALLVQLHWLYIAQLHYTVV